MLNRNMRLKMWITWKLPRWLVMWASIRLMAHATAGPYSETVVPELTVTEALRRWDNVYHI